MFFVIIGKIMVVELRKYFSTLPIQSFLILTS